MSRQRENWFKYGPTALFRFCWLGTEKAQQPLQRVNRAVTHLLSLINQVLDLSKTEAGKLELNPQTVQLAPLIDEVVGTARQLAEGGWVNLCGSKGAYNHPSYPCHYCTYRGGLLRQGAVDKAKADDQRHAGEGQHHHLKVRKAVGGKQRKIVHDTLPKDVPVISRSKAAEGSWFPPEASAL